MKPVAIALWMASVLLETAGQMALKAAATKRPSLIWLGIIAYAGQFAAWLALVSLVPLSQAILVAPMTIVSVMIAGRIAFGEKLTTTRIAGAALVSIGVALAGLA